MAHLLKDVNHSLRNIKIGLGKVKVFYFKIIPINLGIKALISPYMIVWNWIKQISRYFLSAFMGIKMICITYKSNFNFFISTEILLK